MANVPVASGNNFGVVKVANGLRIDTGRLVINRAAIDQIKEGVNGYVPIVPYNQHESTFYGLAKAAGDATQSSSNNAVGNYTDSAKTAIKNMLGVPEDPLAVGTALPASADLNSYTTPGNYTADSTVIASITHAPTTTAEYKLTVEQISDEVIKQTVTTTEAPANVYQRTGDSSSTDWVFGDWVKQIKSTDYASSTTGGVIKVETYSGHDVHNGVLRIFRAQEGDIKAGTQGYKPITPSLQQNSVFYGLSKAAGVDMKDSNNPVGTYTDEAKTAIKNMIGVEDLDVQINGTSIVEDGVANIPLATNSTPGVVAANPNFGTYMRGSDPKTIAVNFGSSGAIKAGTNDGAAISVLREHEATFYGLAKAAGDVTQSTSNNEVGTYTDEAKTAINKMIGSYGLNSGEAIPTNADLNAYTAPGTYNADTTVISGIVNAPTTTETYKLVVESIDDDLIRQTAISKSHVYQRTGDVSTSSWVFTDWVQNITSTDYATYESGGAVRVGGDGLAIMYGKLYVQRATDAEIKACGNGNKPIVPLTQNAATFYGLAKAAGDTTQSTSSNPVGTYTQEAKTAIQTMLGVTVPEVVGSCVEYITDSSVTIVGEPNTRYVCGEVTSIDITPPAVGTIDVTFTSGSTIAILTLPSTVKMPEWWGGVETGYTYELVITDGVYAGVMVWPQ